MLYVNHIYISVERGWFTKYVEEEIGLIHGGYSADVTEQLGAVKLLESNF